MTYSYIVRDAVLSGDILVLTLAPKNPDDHLIFVAGQYATISFTRNDRPTPMRCFSITSTPGNKLLQFAMRVRGDFTQAATKLRPGDNVQVQGAFGEFTIDKEYDEQVVMLAAGIGITPFIGMIRDVTERQIPLPITLLYTNRSVDNIPFYEELQALERRNPYLQITFFCGDNPAIVHTLNDSIRSGRITEQHIKQLTSESYVGSTYFLCGPRAFTASVQAMLQANKVDETRIVSESFTQVTSLSSNARFSIRTVTYGLAAISLIAMTGIIMYLDLSRLHPEPVSIPATSISQTTTSDTSSAGSQANSAAGVPTQTYQQTYQTPVSSVS